NKDDKGEQVLLSIPEEKETFPPHVHIGLATEGNMHRYIGIARGCQDYSARPPARRLARNSARRAQSTYLDHLAPSYGTTGPTWCQYPVEGGKSTGRGSNMEGRLARR